MQTVLIGGGSGFVGMHLSRKLRSAGYEVRHLSRSARPDAEFPTFIWDIQTGVIDAAAFDGIDYVINLAGAGIADERWTAERKQVIIASRTDSTRLLATTLARLGVTPKLYLSASAIGYYGDRGEEILDEAAAPGNGFLSHSCVLWEDSVEEVARLGVPVFINRTGIVLHPEAGALEKMLLPLKLRTSTYFGNGRQFFSWIHIEDLVGIYAYAIANQLTGVYNGTAPNPVRSRAFAQSLGPALHKSALVVPAPAAALELAMGEMSHTVLDSTRCSAAKIEGAGYRFAYPELSQALEQLLG
ncbi:TIGR01777 family oxidoreductase [Lewinella sp. JB7]|uniref:TIGR01777 family oxidoreductase n=1 Tax=Lewinella sp. JB7 TaxID=2962887 RepID=UPI0020CA1056|nr:TIGR01777 family oxidoreductase [Lewinella sp. JB7]MCP9234936.1 TIGR01777 family oxidoreductase [Lewinella sp. JB7]